MSTIYTILDEKISYISIFSSIFFIVVFIFFVKYYIRKLIFKVSIILLIILIIFDIYLDTIYLFKLKSLYKNQKYNVIIGHIQNYKPEIYKKQLESFSVKNIKFELSKDYTNMGFNKTGILQNDIYVKIYYIQEDSKNIILRLDILRK